MLGRADGFSLGSSTNRVSDEPFAASRSDDGRRWVISGWERCGRVWGNPEVPCLHADPVLPDCPPGETVGVHGWLSFYTGDDVRPELARLKATGALGPLPDPPPSSSSPATSKERPAGEADPTARPRRHGARGRPSRRTAVAPGRNAVCAIDSPVGEFARMGESGPANEKSSPAGPEPRSLPIPTTFGGVAALGLGPLRWLVCWQVLLALGAAAAISWALDASWGRDLRRAAERLPDTGEIRAGRLYWPGRQGDVLVQGPFLGIVVNPAAARDTSLTSDFTLSLEGDRLAVRSLMGWMEVPYPPELRLSLSRVEMTGSLGGWTQPVLLAVGVAVFFGLLVVWWSLGLVYGLILWALSAPSGKSPSVGVACRMASAALLLPGVLMTSAIGLYASRELGLLGLLAAVPVHIVAGWIYCLGGLARLPAAVANPFHPEPEARPEAASEPANPFAPR